MQVCSHRRSGLESGPAPLAGAGAAARDERRETLPRGRVRRVLVCSGEALLCERGCLWLVAEGAAAPEDIVLEAGERRVWTRAETLLVEALRDATWTVIRAAPTNQPPR